MQGEPQQVLNSGPVAESSRITSLDLIRGVAVLGILLMNAVSFKYDPATVWNLSAGGSATWLDWSVGVLGEIFVDQKFMGLFSLLFGAGMMLFIDRAAARGARAVLLNLWRNGLLLVIGILHSLLWQGDVLVVYALASLFLLALRKLSARALIILGAVLFLLTAANRLLMQSIANATGAPLAGLWKPTDLPLGQGAMADNLLLLLLLLDYFMRGLGMILMGAGLYRTGFMHGDKAPRTYRRTAVIGLGVGLALAAAGVGWVAWSGFSREVAFIGQVPNTVGTIPAALGYMSLIILWNQRGNSWLKARLRAVGRMALTNYLSQTILGVLILTWLLGDLAIGRAGVLLFVVAVWGLQLWWSPVWLSRFQFGPAEWLWRVATYRRGQPLRRHS